MNKEEKATVCQELRDHLGKLVREVWVRWAKEQTNPKPSWLVSWEELQEADREVDRRIGERLFAEGIDGAIAVCQTRADGERVYNPGPQGELAAAPYERAVEDIKAYRRDGMLRPISGAYAGLTAKKERA